MQIQAVFLCQEFLTSHQSIEIHYLNLNLSCLGGVTNRNDNKAMWKVTCPILPANPRLNEVNISNSDDAMAILSESTGDRWISPLRINDRQTSV